MCKKNALEMKLRVNYEGGELERGWLQEPVRRSIRGTPETDVFRRDTVGPLRQREVTLRWNLRRYIQQTPFDNISAMIYARVAARVTISSIKHVYKIHACVHSYILYMYNKTLHHISNTHTHTQHAYIPVLDNIWRIIIVKLRNI